jgi:hypothetical protein
VIFKLHPCEDPNRRTREIKKLAPDALVYSSGNTDYMIANSSAMVTRYSSVILVALALGKKVYSDLDENLLRKMTPVQNQGKSAENIARVCQEILSS